MDDSNKSTRVSILVRIEDSDVDIMNCLKSLNNQILDDLEVLLLVSIPVEKLEEKTEAGENEVKTVSATEAEVLKKQKKFEELVDVLSDYAKKDARIKLIRMQETDYGKIMNSAVKYARGEYIAILRQADFIDPEFGIEMFALAKKFDADIVRGNYFEYQDGENNPYEAVMAEEAGHIIDPTEDTHVFYQPPIIGSGLYRKEMLNKEPLFMQGFGAKNQDAAFNIKTLASTSAIVLTEKAYLHHNQDEAATPKVTKETMFDINEEYVDAEKYLKKHGKWDVYKYIFQAVKFASYFVRMLQIPEKELETFVLRIRAEFQDAMVKDLVVKNYFPKEHYKVLQNILKYPPRYTLKTLKKYRKGKK